MKIPKYLLAIAVLTFALACSTNACTIDVLGSNQPGTEGLPPTLNASLQVLEQFIMGSEPRGFPPPVLAGASRIDTGLPRAIDVSGFCFIVAYYSAAGDIPFSAEYFHITELPGSCDFTPDPEGPFGGGTILAVDLFKCPDTGTPVMLLGSALAGLGFVRRFLLRRKA